MTSASLITEAEAASISGVSPITLQRFADAGYLQVEQETQGQRLFSRVEVERVFGLASEQPSAPATSEPLGPVVPEAKQAVATQQQPTQQQPIQQSAQELAEQQVQPHADLQQTRIQDFAASDREVSRLTSIVSLQEKYIELKEQELKNLREERDWLRTRIERLEEKNDRDQLILVSVTETNRGLTKALENRRSTFKSALEWIGLLPTLPERPRGD